MKKSAALLGFLILTIALSGVFVRVHAQTPAASDKDEIEALITAYSDAFNTRNVDGIMSCYARGKALFVFDAVPPREYPSWDSYKRDWEGLLSAFPGPVKTTVSDIDITVVGPVAYGHDIQSSTFTRKDGSSLNAVVRVTDVFRKIKGKWLIVQEHVSFPVDLETGKADLLSTP
jgi:ketosteroid isomerase-like protein